MVINDMKKYCCIIFIGCSFITNAQTTNFNIKNFGAKGDGITLDTKAINDAIDAASKNGGGTVYFPAGNYLSFSIRLKNNISLFLDAGSVFIFIAPFVGFGFIIADKACR